MSSDYHSTRIPPDPRRDVLWQALWKYHFSKQIGPDHCVLELGCGYGSFINAVEARRRIALDAWPEFPHYLRGNIEPVVGSVMDVGQLVAGPIDFALASNLFEHITQQDLAKVLDGLRPLFNPGGTLTIIQPNWTYAFREYFDDYTHVTVYSHVSLADFLRVNGYEVVDVQPRFLPLTIKSRLPVSPALIGAYLASPIKPMGKQMLIRAKPR